MTFKDEITLLINHFIRCNNHKPNELQLGKREVNELYDSIQDLELFDEVNEDMEYCGLKLKILDTKTFMKVDYNEGRL